MHKLLIGIGLVLAVAVAAGVFSYSTTPQISSSPTPAPTTSTEKCYVGGCSGQLCTDDPDAVSTCEYREEYACYSGAECKRQSNGQCGWTQTSQLRYCLENLPGRY